jgi:hypothetical protein
MLNAMSAQIGDLQQAMATLQETLVLIDDNMLARLDSGFDPPNTQLEQIRGFGESSDRTLSDIKRGLLYPAGEIENPYLANIDAYLDTIRAQLGDGSYIPLLRSTIEVMLLRLVDIANSTNNIADIKASINGGVTDLLTGIAATLDNDIKTEIARIHLLLYGNNGVDVLTYLASIASTAGNMRDLLVTTNEYLYKIDYNTSSPMLQGVAEFLANLINNP